MTDLGKDDDMDLAGDKWEWVHATLGRKMVAGGANDKGLKGPSEEDRFYHGANRELLQGTDMARRVD